MTLADGYHDLPPGKVAVVVTSLEMRARPPARSPLPPQTEPKIALTIRAQRAPTVDWYRDLHARVGADWLWFSRLSLSPAALEAIIRDPAVHIWALERDGRDEGLLELDFRVPGECELAFFGLTRPLIGQGAGRLLMQRAIAEAWSRPIERFWVHTCTGDHPGAVEFYTRSGFVPFARQIEIFDDPRLDGLIAETAAPHVPMIRTPRVGR
jgi:GNAT superfamily N-acetyltransferase